MARSSIIRLVLAGVTSLLLLFHARVHLTSQPAPSARSTSAVAVQQSLPANTHVPDLAAATLEPAHGLPFDALHARAVTTWESAIQKGSAFICAWESGTAPQSEFLQYSDLDKWGWSSDPENVDFNVGPVRAAFSDLGLSINSPPNQKESCGHFDDKTTDGTLYKATGAEYQQTFNVEQGIIIVAWIHSPVAVIQEYKDDNYQWPWPAPQLWRWSDVSFLLWQQQCSDSGKPVAGLEWVFHETIMNDSTKALIFQALGGNANSITSWPGKTFHACTDAGKALIGSPNASGTAWMLAQHNTALAGKVIDRIVVYDPAAQPGRNRPEAQIKPCMAIHVTDGPSGLW
ncbi:hypothetical protein LTR85_003739 [Meristemomyces frigidus]|nr:hypothetical protein LTR85_003739 [Meristemomyces frigidus]